MRGIAGERSLALLRTGTVSGLLTRYHFSGWRRYRPAKSPAAGGRASDRRSEGSPPRTRLKEEPRGGRPRGVAGPAVTPHSGWLSVRPPWLHPSPLRPRLPPSISLPVNPPLREDHRSRGKYLEASSGARRAPRSAPSIGQRCCEGRRRSGGRLPSSRARRESGW